MSLIAEIERVVSQNKSTFKPLQNEFNLINDYEDLIAKGLIKPRGYTLQTIDEKQNVIVKNSTYYRENVEEADY